MRPILTDSSSVAPTESPAADVPSGKLKCTGSDEHRMYDVAFIGTGPNPDDSDWGTSAAMAYLHADGYANDDRCELVACADLVGDHADAFADEWNLDSENVFEDYTAMLDATAPDIVSVCTPVPTHAEIVVDVVESGGVDAIHCEKPMADTWGDCRRMAAVADAHGVQLTFNHQRRFSETVARADEFLEDVGEIERFECGGKNLLDFGSHLVDLCNRFNDEAAPEWALCQVDYREENVRYGTHNENRALAQWRYANGVDAMLSAGEEPTLVECGVRIVGTEGELRLWPTDRNASLTVRLSGESSLRDVDVDPRPPMDGIVSHLVDCLESRATPEVGAANVRNGHRVVFGCYESVRRRGVVEFPLEFDDNPLEDLVARGELDPR